MRFDELPLAGAFLVEVEKLLDERGFFARTFCEEEFAAQGLIMHFSQASVSFNLRHGTVRGMHFSVGPHAETKIVRCTSGSIQDVIIDLRRESKTYLQVFSVELSAKNRKALYIPVGLAHGFQTLEAGAEVIYLIDVPYAVEAARGVRWNDPAFDIRWPLDISIISERDLQFPDWSP
jgi:dTDP-4-dehydrorhamnose 3,5-epimerase